MSGFFKVGVETLLRVAKFQCRVAKFQKRVGNLKKLNENLAFI